MAFGPIQLGQGPARADGFTAKHAFNRQFDQPLQAVDFSDQITDATLHVAIVQRRGKPGVGLAGGDQLAQFAFEAPGAVHAVGGAFDRQHADGRVPAFVRCAQARAVGHDHVVEEDFGE
ncbi:hypothetical protein D3C87_1427960 [compost metagenome]